MDGAELPKVACWLDGYSIPPGETRSPQLASALASVCQLHPPYLSIPTRQFVALDESCQ